ncbi:hypothetical protein [Terrimonas pollutisoli]|uniref:hypothetical protein n=1 Tax=Terrimonas pollutisoli TaxID=3034147 RepID=UPI0023EAE01A|nr:hypothetical protein [Terrimonas sp. H1YJ31]
MKLVLIFIFVFFTLAANSQEDYILQLNDTTLNVALDKPYHLVVKGKKIAFRLIQKDTLTYSNNLYSFFYPKGFKISNVSVDEGIEQISLLTAEGSGLLIQNYESMNPSTLNEFMLNEVTKESISYGFEEKRTSYKKILRSGQELVVTKAVLRYKDEVNIYEIASIGRKDSGLMIVTMRMDEVEGSQGQKIIDMMWKSLQLKW